MKAKSAKAKGTRLEKWVCALFNSIPGWTARKQPGSGIYQDFKHDVWAKREKDGNKFITECKSWKHGWRTGDKAMGMADFLVIKRDFGPAMIYMKASTFAELVADE